MAFYVVLVLIPLLFFAALEGTLHMVGYGRDYQVFHKPVGYTPDMLYVNSDISYKYFGHLQGAVFFRGIGFYEQKPQNAFRVFVLGGSSAQGFPYAQNASFPKHLQRRLELDYPDRLIEVINMGASAINSHTLLDILPAVLEQSPDLILIYAGHNEYYGALGPGSSRNTSPGFVKLLLQLRTLRIYQLGEHLMRTILEGGNKSDNQSLMQDMIGQSLIELGSDTYQQGLAQFESNLTEMLAMIKEAGVPVVVGTLASNLSGHTPFNHDQLDDEGRSALDYFELAREAALNGDSISAKVNYIKAKELDGLRFRAPEEMNRLITDLAEAFEVPIADVNQYLSDHSTFGIIGDQLMCDHLHPNLEGYYQMSKGFYECLDEQKLLPGKAIVRGDKEIDSLLMARFPFTQLDTIMSNRTIWNLIGTYPFVAHGAPNPYQDLIDHDDFEHRVTAIHEIDSIRGLVAVKHLANEDSTAFKKEMGVFMSYLPANEHLYLRAIKLLSEKKLLDDAYPMILDQLVGLPESKSKYKALGMYYEHVGQLDSALVYYNKAVGDDVDTYLLEHRGYVHLVMEKYPEAIKDFTQVTKALPNKPEAYHQRGIAKFELKDYQGTLDDFTQVIDLSKKPDSLAYLIRGYAYVGVKKQELACEDWQMSAKLGSSQAMVLLSRFCKGK